MKDKNGMSFEIGAALQSTQSIGDAGIIICIDIKGDVATFTTRDRFGKDDFKFDQSLINSSEWELVNSEDSNK